MPTEIVLVGGGGHAKVVCATLRLQDPKAIVRVVDDDPAMQGKELLGIRIEAPPRRLSDAFAVAHVCVGDNGTRREIAERLVSSGVRLFTIVHPRAAVAPGARVSDGVFVAAGAVVGPDAAVGTGAIVNHGAIVDHDCWVGDYAHIGPNATLGGSVRIGGESLVGAGAVLLPSVTIGERVVIGAGAVVTRPVAAGRTVAGVPARTLA